MIIPLSGISSKQGSLSNVQFSASENKIILPPGTYNIKGRVFGCGVVRFQAAIAANGTLIGEGESLGSSKDSFAAGLTLAQVSEVNIVGTTFTSESEIQLAGIYQHYHEFGASTGVAVFGDSSVQIPVTKATGSTENYSSLEIIRVA